MHSFWLGLAFVFAAEPMAPGKDLPATVELLEDMDEKWLDLLNNDGGLDETKASIEFRDFYSGISSVRVTPHQRFCSKLPGWNFTIAEKPEPGQYRYIRFAWKRLGGEGIMLQLHCPEQTWNHRLLSGKAGPSTAGWGSMLSIAEQMPQEWTVVTRDLFKDFGAITITGIALTPMEEGTAGLFDHIHLGRTIADLDTIAPKRIANAAPALDLSPKQLEQAWLDLGSPDSKVARPAVKLFLASPKLSLPYLQSRLEANKPKEGSNQEIRQLILQLDDKRFRTREMASAELGKMGPRVIPFLKESLQASSSVEVRERLQALVQKLETQPSGLTGDQLRFIRTLRILEWASTPESRKVLEQLAKQHQDSEWQADIRATLRRLPQP